MKTFLKTYWSDVAFGVLMIILVWMVTPLLKEHMDEHQMLRSHDGWSFRKVVVAPQLPCANCGNTIFQLYNVTSDYSVTAVCCQCGVSLIEIDCRNNDAICGLHRALRTDTSKYKLKIGDTDYIPAHTVYNHKQ